MADLKTDIDAEKNKLDIKLREVGGRIRALREIEGFSAAEVASRTGVSLDEYLASENGSGDLNFAFLYRCASVLSVDVTDLIEGTSPRLSAYTLTRKGEGQRIEQAHGMVYYNLAAAFRNRIAEPLYVVAAYDPGAVLRPIEVTSHDGQECDIVVKGQLRVQVGDHTEDLGPGDSIYYNSAAPHGMIAIGGEDCVFYAIVLNPLGETEPLSQEQPGGIGSLDRTAEAAPARTDADQDRLWKNYIDPVEDEIGALRSIGFKNTEKFNFAFDIVDELGKKKPDKLALLHISRDGTERRFTFGDIRHESARAANYFKALGIRRGDRVMLVLRRNYQFWIAMMGLCKLGAIAIPATDQLLAHDFEYRFGAAGISAIIVTADSQVAVQAEAAFESCPGVTVRIITNGSREGWHSFDEECPMYSSHFTRGEDSICGDDLMLMYFTSGTTGYPKIAAHNCRYPLGHFVTARYWQCVDPNGLHLTISDTGWAKAAWGKLYGQWLCEAAIFVYDFDRFKAADIMPMFAKYGITTFCAPPTMYRFMIKEDLSSYDFSSIKHASIAGEALNPEVYNQFKRATGLSLTEGFGQSESTVMIGNLIGTTPKIGSMGKPVPLYEIELVDGDDKPVPPGEVGEIVVRAHQGQICGLTVGYYGNEEATAAAWKNGYYHTGDTAWMDEDGYFWYVGRVDDVIKSSGYRIGPFEIESVIMELPYVLECGVSAAPDPIRGQVVKASIVLTKDRQPSDELKAEIQNYVKSHTAPYKYPRIIVFRDELPKTTSGKIIRNKL